MIDLSGMDKAIAALHDAFQIYDANPLAEDVREKIIIRDGVIQRFEIAFEISWKMLRRVLREYGLEQVDALSNRDLFRVGQEQGMVANAGQWFYFLKMRNQTSHVYNDARAHEVFLAARDFLPAARHLFGRLQERIK